MKVLVVGGGGREHAIAWKLKKSHLLKELYCAPGNAGTAGLATNVSISPKNLGALAVWAVEHEIDLTVVGPEVPLAEGIVDVFNEHGLRIFGPTKKAAELESSKAFAKDVMQKAGVPTPAAEIFSDYESALAYLQQVGAPVVVKADGLAAGKGVTVAMEMEDAEAALKECMLEDRFGTSGSRVVIEEYIDGREASVMAIIAGDTILPLVVSQDYKRLEEEDKGPNTGGMGAISPTPVVDDSQVESLVDKIFVPVLKELRTRGIEYLGFLYAGVIVNSAGESKVLEFNCRLGDPETQVLLPRMQSDLLQVLDAAVRGTLSSHELRWSREAAATVVASSRGYPGDCDDGKTIDGLFDGDDDVMVFQAGTSVSESGEIVSKGGRILVVSALGNSTAKALEKAYEGMSKITFDGMHFRKDIGGGAA